VALELVLVASTLNDLLLDEYSALCMETVSPVDAGDTLRVAVLVRPP
jgi:hypothetical protein